MSDTPRTDALLARINAMPPVRLRGELIGLCRELERDGNYWAGQAIELEAAQSARGAAGTANGPLMLDTEREVFFYEQDHYYLSNFSSFRLRWAGMDFATSEHAYHWYRFNGVANMHQEVILATRSAHDVFRYAQENKAHQRPEWDEVKVGVMKEILRAKAEQHEYVRRKLLQTGERSLIENSWRDPFWGWGENRDGENMLGKLWMEVRAELRTAASTSESGATENTAKGNKR